MPRRGSKMISDLSSPEAWEEACFRDAAYFQIQIYVQKEEHLQKKQGVTDDWEQVRNVAAMAARRAVPFLVYAISKRGHRVLLPTQRWRVFDEIWKDIQAAAD